MHASLFTALALAAVSVKAIQITSPDKETVWGTSGSHTIEWDTVSTDPDSFDVLLVNFASYPTTSETLQSDVSSSDGSLTVSFPGGSWPEGNGFQINLINSKTTSILNQSNQFNITSDGETESSSAASSSSSAASSSSASSSSASSSSARITTSASSASSTGAAASSASASASSSNGTIPGSTTGGTSGASVAFTFSGAAVVGALCLIGAALV